MAQKFLVGRTDLHTDGPGGGSEADDEEEDGEGKDDEAQKEGGRAGG